MRYTVTWPDGRKAKFWKEGGHWRIERRNGYSGFSLKQDALDQISEEGGTVQKNPSKPKRGLFTLYA